MKQEKITIIIPTLNEERHIAECLDSILDANYDKAKMEVFVVDGMSQDKTAEIIQEYHEKHHFIHLLKNLDAYTPIGMRCNIISGQDGVTIEENAIVWAGSLVNIDIPSHAKEVGVPIKVLNISGVVEC